MFPDKPLTEDALKTLSNTLINARKQASIFETFPGDVPSSLDAAYRVQDMSLAQWNDDITGWKVGMVVPELREQMGAERLMGPIFKKVSQEKIYCIKSLPIFVYKIHTILQKSFFCWVLYKWK